MYRVEIISNKSVQEDIEKTMERNIEDFFYTIIPLAYGRGKRDRKLGTSTWPETNFVMVSYIEDRHLESVRKIIAAIKEKFPDEGIKLFCMKAE